ncbi:MAG: hypothetical protein SVZ03_13225 [Spirochaetota bacterium]|nr:hypothetical protein [Spirochaetota bacterium]
MLYNNNKVQKCLLSLLVITLIGIHSRAALANLNNRYTPPRVVVFSKRQKNITINALTDKSVESIKNVFNELGRFLPIDDTHIQEAIEKSKLEDIAEGDYDSLAKILRADIYMIVSVTQIMDLCLAEARVIPRNPDYKLLEKRIRVRSRIMMNIPMKLGREIAYMHKNLPIRAGIIKNYDNGLSLINVGQWHGIDKSEYPTIQGDLIEVIQLGRLESIVRIKGRRRKAGELISIEVFPDIKRIICERESNISRLTIDKYGLENTLLLSRNPGKRMIEGICIVNMGSNICIPGYGAFLSTNYLGFNNHSSDIGGIVVSTGAILTHISLPWIITGFKINPLPWEDDSDRDQNMKNIHIFLWATLPVIFSVAYMDQLAYQFKKNELLPPYFGNNNATALLFSAFIPGGGLFYKGHRALGWGFYFSEMFLGGYSLYYKDSKKKGSTTLIALGVIKLFEFISAYYIKPSYRFYNIEMEREFQRVSLDLRFEEGNEGDNIISISIPYRY